MKTIPLRTSTTYSAPALEKGLDILEALAATDTPQSLADLARTLGRSSSELFRALSSLEKRAYIIKDLPSGRYRLSLKLYELAHIHPPVEQLLRAAAGPMRNLAYSLRQSCHLSVLNQGRLVVLAEAGSPEQIRLAIAVGSTFPPCKLPLAGCCWPCFLKRCSSIFWRKTPTMRNRARCKGSD